MIFVLETPLEGLLIVLARLKAKPKDLGVGFICRYVSRFFMPASCLSLLVCHKSIRIRTTGTEERVLYS